eukprot:6375469-Prymnesium_polylepis.1
MVSAEELASCRHELSCFDPSGAAVRFRSDADVRRVARVVLRLVSPPQRDGGGGGGGGGNDDAMGNVRRCTMADAQPSYFEYTHPHAVAPPPGARAAADGGRASGGELHSNHCAHSNNRCAHSNNRCAHGDEGRPYGATTCAHEAWEHTDAVERQQRPLSEVASEVAPSAIGRAVAHAGSTPIPSPERHSTSGMPRGGAQPAAGDDSDCEREGVACNHAAGSTPQPPPSPPKHLPPPPPLPPAVLNGGIY